MMVEPSHFPTTPGGSIDLSTIRNLMYLAKSMGTGLNESLSVSQLYGIGRFPENQKYQ